VFVILPFYSWSQLVGLILRNNTGKPLSGASVSLIKDKAAGSKTFSSHDGYFMLQIPPPGKYQLAVSFLGYSTVVVPFEVFPQETKITLANIELQSAAIHLSGVEVKTAKALVKISRDTLEYSAKDFATAENASLQNLLEKMPGFYIDPYGDVFFDGKQIKEINIDGRRIQVSSISGLGKISALQQLLAGVADKIQVISKKNNGLIGTGTTDQKILNITIRKEAKKGINGALGTGYGTQNRFNGAANASLLRDDKQFMISTGGSNVNSMRSPSSTDESEYLNDRLGGIIPPLFINSSASIDLSKKIRISANLFHHTTNLSEDLISRRDNILPDSIFHYNAVTIRNGQISGDNFFSSTDITFNDFNKLSIGINGILIDQQSHNSGSYLTQGGAGDSTNYGKSDNTSSTRNRNFDLNGNYAFTFKNQKAQVRVFWDISTNKSADQQNNNNLNHLSQGQGDTLHQMVSSQTRQRRLNVGASFSRLLIKGLYFNGEYSFNSNTTSSLQKVAEIDPEKPGHFIPNAQLSYDFRNLSSIHVLSAALNFQKQKIDGGLSFSFNQNNSWSQILSSAASYSQNLRYWAPAFEINYHFSEQKTMSLHLSSRTGMIDRKRSLLPVISTQNPLYLELGNPDLKPAIDRNLTLDYSQRGLSGFTFSLNSSATAQTLGISTSVSSDSTGRQITKPINVDGNYTIRTIIDIAKRFNTLQLTLKYNSFSAFSHSTTFINGIENKTGNFRSDHKVSLSWMYHKSAEIALAGNIGYFGTHYSQQATHTDFILYKTYLSVNTFLPLGLSVGAATVNTQNTNQKQQYNLVNAWLSKTCLKDKSLLFKLYGYDLFASNKSLQTMPGPTFIETSQSNVLERYFMLSVSYFFGKK
jgi:hypothetical protein